MRVQGRPEGNGLSVTSEHKPEHERMQASGGVGRPPGLRVLQPRISSSSRQAHRIRVLTRLQPLWSSNETNAIQNDDAGVTMMQACS